MSGVYKGEISDDSLEEIQGVITDFVEEEGRSPRILVAKMGQDGHDRGQK